MWIRDFLIDVHLFFCYEQKLNSQINIHLEKLFQTVLEKESS